MAFYKRAANLPSMFTLLPKAGWKTQVMVQKPQLQSRLRTHELIFLSCTRCRRGNLCNRCRCLFFQHEAELFFFQRYGVNVTATCLHEDQTFLFGSRETHQRFALCLREECVRGSPGAATLFGDATSSGRGLGVTRSSSWRTVSLNWHDASEILA